MTWGQSSGKFSCSSAIHFNKLCTGEPSVDYVIVGGLENISDEEIDLLNISFFFSSSSNGIMDQ